MEAELKNLCKGKYNLKDKLYFTGIVELEYKYLEDKLGFPKITIDKKSALEIMSTLLDSLDLLNKDTEELIYKVEDKINDKN